MRSEVPDLQGWVPVQAALDGPTLAADLCRVGGHRFVEPFFDDSISHCMRLPFNAAFGRRLDCGTLARWLRQHPGLSPSGFIFHLSRCGSTLVSQWLAASPAHRVISEAAPIDAALRAGGAAVDDATRIGWLQTLLGMLGQPGSADERRYFVKFDSWHALQLPLILRACPQVPWLFIVRDPVEIIVSHLKRPGVHMVPGLLGLAPPPGVAAAQAAVLPRESYCARVLGALCAAAEGVLDAGAPRACVVDYGALPQVLDAVVRPHFGLDPDAAGIAAMAAALRRDAKNPAFEFSPDSAGKQRDATVAVREAAERWATPAYRRLLARAAGGSAIGGPACSAARP